MTNKDAKTTRNEGDVTSFLSDVENQQRREDALRLCGLMHEVTGEKPAMWGSSIVGFGSYHYKYASGREGDWLKIGFSPRKANLTLYFMDGFDDYGDLLEKLGPHKTAKSCLYIKSLKHVDENILRQLIEKSFSSTSMGES